MARKTGKKQRSKSTAKSRPTGEQLLKAVGQHHARLERHIDGVLRDAGLKGVRVHSLRFSVTSNAFSGPGCDPPCPSGQQCVLDSNGGTVSWVCVGGSG